LIDTHCHLLAGLDDGPVSFNESIRMARRLVENGVRLAKDLWDSPPPAPES